MTKPSKIYTSSNPVLLNRFANKVEDVIYYLQDTNNRGYQDIHYAAFLGDLQTVRNLLSGKTAQEKTQFLNQATSDGYTPLYLAVKHGNVAKCELLLINGADLSGVDGSSSKSTLESVNCLNKYLWAKKLVQENKILNLKEYSELKTKFDNEDVNIDILLSNLLLNDEKSTKKMIIDPKVKELVENALQGKLSPASKIKSSSASSAQENSTQVR